MKSKVYATAILLDEDLGQAIDIDRTSKFIRRFEVNSIVLVLRFTFMRILDT